MEERCPYNTMPNDPTSSGLADNRPEDNGVLSAQKGKITAKWRYGRESKHLVTYKTNIYRTVFMLSLTNMNLLTW
jgi:hypothetical protein